jgi:glycosyltransferase involved in cell wall biosynthesis
MPLLNAFEFTVRHRAEAWRLNQYSITVAVRRAAREKKFDLIESPEFGALGDLLNKGEYTRLLAVRLHTAIFDFVRFKNGQRAPLIPLDEMARDLALRADVLTAPTEFARQSIADFWEVPLANTKIIGNPVRPAPEPRVFGLDGTCSSVFWGRLEPRKGVDSLAASIGKVRQKFPNFRARFFGADNAWHPTGTGAEVIRKIAAETGGEGGYEISPPLSHDCLKEIVSRASVCVLPSRAETFGMSFAEAMMWGAPCVVSDIAPFRELATDGVHALFANPENPEQLADQQLRLLYDRDLAARLCKNAYYHIQAWTVDRIVSQLLDAWFK